MKIGPKTTRERLAAIVVKKLEEHEISAVLVGGSVVSLYTDNEYESCDLDFVSSADHDAIARAMRELGFEARGREFRHPNSEFTVEFPPGPLAIGNDEPILPEGEWRAAGVNIKLLSPTQSVMDRLAWFYHSNDRQCLDQALLIARAHPVDLKRVEAWSERENALEKFQTFRKRLR